MPMTPNRKPSIVSDRRQSILGTERVIEEAGDEAEAPRIKSTGIHVDPDVAFMDRRGKGKSAADQHFDDVVRGNPPTHENTEDLGVMPTRNEGERYFHSRMEQEAHEAEQARRPRGRPRKASIPGRQGFQVSDPEPALSHEPLPIEDAPPLPPRQATGEWHRYPVAKMVAGEFFFIPKGGSRETSQVRALAHRLKVSVKIRRNYTHKGVIGVGVWKV